MREDRQGGSGTPTIAGADVHLQVGRMVSVLPRIWPGMNRPGGIGRIEALHTDRPTSACTGASGASAASAASAPGDAASGSSYKASTTCGTTRPCRSVAVTFVDVRYVECLVLGGRERRVPIEYVLPAPECDYMHMHSNEVETRRDVKDEKEDEAGRDATRTRATHAHYTAAASSASASASTLTSASASASANLRDRSVLPGRYELSGSPRSDCASCGWVVLETQARAEATSVRAEAKAAPQAPGRTPPNRSRTPVYSLRCPSTPTISDTSRERCPMATPTPSPLLG